MIPAQEVSAFPPGTPEWAQWQIRNVFDAADARVITDCVAAGLVGYVSLGKARLAYAMACHRCQWQGWQARLAWACIEALLAGPIADADDDIPF